MTPQPLPTSQPHPSRPLSSPSQSPARQKATVSGIAFLTLLKLLAFVTFLLLLVLKWDGAPQVAGTSYYIVFAPLFAYFAFDTASNYFFTITKPKPEQSPEEQRTMNATDEEDSGVIHITGWTNVCESLVRNLPMALLALLIAMKLEEPIGTDNREFAFWLLKVWSTAHTDWLSPPLFPSLPPTPSLELVGGFHSWVHPRLRLLVLPLLRAPERHRHVC